MSSVISDFHKHASNPYLSAEDAFIVMAIAIHSAGHAGNSDKRSRDMVTLIKAYLSHTGQESLGWALTAKYVEDKATKERITPTSIGI